MKRNLYFILSLCMTVGATCLPSIAWTQVEAPPIVESDGDAQIEVPPAYAEFSLEYRRMETTLKASTNRVLRFEEDLRKALKQADLLPISVRVSGVRFDGLPDTQARVLAHVRFTVDPLSTPEDRAHRTAEVSDSLHEIAKLLNAEIKGPYYGIDNKEAVEQEAIARATENALYKADAVALVMNISIVAVQSVRVLDVNWGQEAATAGERRADADRLVCTARTRIVYQMSAP